MGCDDRAPSTAENSKGAAAPPGYPKGGGGPPWRPRPLRRPAPPNRRSRGPKWNGICGP